MTIVMLTQIAIPHMVPLGYLVSNVIFRKAIIETARPVANV